MDDFLPAPRLSIVVLHHSNITPITPGLQTRGEMIRTKWQEVAMLIKNIACPTFVDGDDSSRRGRQTNREHRQKESLQCKLSFRQKSVTFLNPFLPGHAIFSADSRSIDRRDGSLGIG